MARDYKLSNDERMMFDWLVVKQEDFGLEKPFRHSIPQVQDATAVARYSQEKAIKHFQELGFLSVGQDFYQNNPYKTYFVNFQILSDPKVLGEIIKPDTETFKEFSEWINELAKAQAKKEKPLSKTKQKQMEKETAKAKEEAEALYKRLCNNWKKRVDMYNSGELTPKKPTRTRIYSQLPLGKHGIHLLCKLRTVYDDTSIEHGFTVFADKCLRGEIKPKKILLYFLAHKDGQFEVVEDMINEHALDYGCNNF